MASIGSLFGSATTSTPPPSANSSAANSQNPAAMKTEFLQLLVAQLKNQDPMNPADGTQFVSQLTQISELEQVVGIRQDADSLLAKASPASAPAATPPPSPTQQP